MRLQHWHFTDGSIDIKAWLFTEYDAGRNPKFYIEISVFPVLHQNSVNSQTTVL